MSDGPTLQVMRDTLITIANAAWIGRRATLAGWVLLVYDWVISFDQEVDLIWDKPWNIAKGLYYFNRYIPLMLLCVHTMIYLNLDVSKSTCLFWFQFEGWTGMTCIGAVEAILATRVWALWDGNRIILGILLFGLAAEMAVMSFILGTTSSRLDTISEVFPGVEFKVCIPLNTPPYFFAFWIPPLAFGTMVLILACYRGLTSVQFGLRDLGKTLVAVILRDSVMYFAAIVATDLLCTTVWLQRSDVLFQTVVGPGLAVPSVLGSRLLLNLREVYYKPYNTGTLATRTFELPTIGRPARAPRAGSMGTPWAIYPSGDTHVYSGRNTTNDVGQ